MHMYRDRHLRAWSCQQANAPTLTAVYTYVYVEFVIMNIIKSNNSLAALLAIFLCACRHTRTISLSTMWLNIHSYLIDYLIDLLLTAMFIGTVKSFIYTRMQR